MSISILSQSYIIPQLRAMLAMLVAQAQILVAKPKYSGTKLFKTVQSIRRLTKAIIMAEVMVYQSRLKAAMLADPKWRERVIFDLGGHWALRDWQARRRLCQQRQNENAGPSAPSKPPHSAGAAPHSKNKAAVDDKRGQFRLPPLSRRSFGARQNFGRAEHRIASAATPMNAPIIVTPYELTSSPARQGPYPSPASATADTKAHHHRPRYKPP